MKAGTIYLNGATAGNNFSSPDGTFDNHDRIMQTAFHFFHELFGPTTEYKRAGFCLGAPFEDVVSFSANCVSQPYEHTT